MKKEYIDTDEVPQMAEDTGGSGGCENYATESEAVWKYIGFSVVAIIILFAVSALISILLFNN